ncbi:unnamed protein product, partial [Mesorhabditis spiculigera]
MNIFRLAADMSHLVAIFLLLKKMWTSRSVSGISAKSQLLFAVVFVTRYLDLFTTFVSPYNTVMKVFFIASSIGTLYLIYGKFRPTYERASDNFKEAYLIIPCAALALLINADFTFMEVMWTFSIYLEAVAIMPQLFMLSTTRQAETITAHYLFFLGLYRGLYLLNWIYRYYTEDFFDPIVTVAGIVQTVLYADFFYLYVTRVVRTQKNLELPI